MQLRRAVCYVQGLLQGGRIVHTSSFHNKWRCDACFEYNSIGSECASCGTPAPTPAQKKSTPVCGSVRNIIGSKQNIVTSGTKQPAVSPTEWFCPSCKTSNYRSRTTCRGCYSERSSSRPESLPTSTPVPSMKPLTPTARKNDDWICVACGTLNFAIRSSCFRCSAKKIAPLSSQALSPWSCPLCRTVNDANRKFCVQCMEPIQLREVVPVLAKPSHSASAVKHGDWFCPACSTHNYAVRTKCFRCGESSSTPSKLVAARPSYPELEWVCPNAQCKTQNYASRDRCWLCDTKKPGAQWTCSKCHAANAGDVDRCQSCHSGRGPSTTGWRCVCGAANSKVDDVCASCKQCRPFEWECSTCGTSTEASICPGCGDEAPWKCPMCGALTPANLDVCGTCEAGQKPRGSNPQHRGSDRTEGRETVWICSQCQLWNFMNRSECIGCAALRINNKATVKLQWQCDACGFSNGPANKVCAQCGVGAKRLPGDWNCGRCKALNFAHRQICLECSLPREAAVAQSDDGERILSQLENDLSEDGPVDLEEPSLVGWQCTLCGETNPDSLSKCSMCGIGRIGE